MTTFDIFKTALMAVVDNLGAAVRISGAVFVIVIFASNAINVALFGQLQPAPFDPQQPVIPAAQIYAMLLNSVVLLIGFSWVSINWHRFVLIGEDAHSLLHGWNLGRILRYCLRSLAIVAVSAIVVAIPITIVVILLSALGLAAMSGFAILAGFLIGFYAFFRLGLILPACALDQPIGLAKSLELTKDYRAAIWGLAGLNIALTVIVSSLAGLLAFDNVIGVIMTAVLQWAMVLLSASFLTTLYQVGGNQNKPA